MHLQLNQIDLCIETKAFYMRWQILYAFASKSNRFVHLNKSFDLVINVVLKHV